jgi:hypothetical protein
MAPIYWCSLACLITLSQLHRLYRADWQSDYNEEIGIMWKETVIPYFKI